jgi:hypothetical protein
MVRPCETSSTRRTRACSHIPVQGHIVINTRNKHASQLVRSVQWVTSNCQRQVYVKCGAKVQPSSSSSPQSPSSPLVHHHHHSRRRAPLHTCECWVLCSRRQQWHCIGWVTKFEPPTVVKRHPHARGPFSCSSVHRGKCRSQGHAGGYQDAP